MDEGELGTRGGSVGGRHGHGGAGVAVAVAGGTATPPAPLVPGFQLGELLARGGTSEVWLGVEEASGRRVAVKVVGADLDALEVAAREASLSASAASAHVVPIDACIPLADGRAALVMPHVRGGALDALVRARGHLAPGEVVTVLAPLASALGRLHDLGVVHGDVSPGNVLLELDGRPLLADLGLGHVVGEVAHGVWGTDGYVAPEVLMGGDPGPAADVYAVGAVGWLCLSGQVPGPPGLRPTLAEVSRAGDGAGGVVAVLEAAVGPVAADRPTAHELAWQLFHTARPEPLHLVRGDDETSAVTYRLRAAADRPPDDAPRPSPWARLAAAVGSRWAVRRDRPAPLSPPPLSPPRMSPSSLLPARSGAPRRPRGRHAGRVVRPGAGSGRWRSVLALVGVLVGLVVTAVVVLPAQRAEAPARARPAALPPVGSDVRTDPAAPRERPTQLLAALAQARAVAWREATAAHLHGADAPGSAAESRDRAAVTDLARSGLRYTGLAYVVRDAVTVDAGAASARIRARFDTSAYEVTGPTGSTPRGAVAGEEVVVTLVLTDVGWRVSDLSAAP
ncbi:protein kinase domain-containing protein [Oryzobacter telluris]|uniref:protein kinase domain-containing protein n=1 Tax=Oryzobacter telluris TaxID=3149179 RepID=UPI00370D6618